MAARALRSALSCCLASCRSKALSSAVAACGSAVLSATGKQYVTILKPVRLLTTCTAHEHMLLRRHKLCYHCLCADFGTAFGMEQHTITSCTPLRGSMPCASYHLPAKKAAMQGSHAEHRTLSCASIRAAMTGGSCSAFSICAMEYAESSASPSPLCFL